jgi:ABC-type lipoprotein release transport system permease subunit
MILKLIWRNIWRNKRRTLITMSSVSFAVLLAVTMKSLQKGVFDHLVKNMVSFYTGYIQIHQKGYWEEQVLDNSFENKEKLQQSVEVIPGVNKTAGRLETFALASTGSTTYGCMVTGVDPEEEDKITRLKSRLISGKYFGQKENSVLVVEGLAQKLNIKLNDTIVLLGQGFQGSTAAGKYPVSGILRYGSPSLNSNLIFLTLTAAQDFLSASNRVTTVAVMINTPEKLEDIYSAINKVTGPNFEVMTWKKILPDIENHIRADSLNFYIFIGVLYLLVAFGIFGTILMMLAERNYEIGMLIAVGMKRIKIIAMLIGETILISILGTIAGLALSFPIVSYFESNPIRFTGEFAETYKKFGFEAIWPAVVDPEIFLTQALIILGLALLISLYPLAAVMRHNMITSIKR